MCPEWVSQAIMPRKDKEGKPQGQPIIELQTEREVEETHIAIGGERFKIRIKIERPLICRKCMKFGHEKNTAPIRKNIVRNVQSQ